MPNFRFNRFSVAGKLTLDPELRTTQNGLPVANAVVAVDRPKTKDSEQRAADFIRLTAFDKQAQTLASYFRKGSSIYAEGRIQNHNYTDSSGQKRYEYNFVVNNIQFIDSKSDYENIKSRDNTSDQYSGNNGGIPPHASEDEDLPF